MGFNCTSQGTTNSNIHYKKILLNEVSPELTKLKWTNLSSTTNLMLSGVHSKL